MFDTQDYRSRHVASIKQKAGPRYTPELNVELPVSAIFDGIGRTELFYREIRTHLGKLLKEFRGISSVFDDKGAQESYNAICDAIERLGRLVGEFKEYGVREIPWNHISDAAKGVEECARTLSSQLRKAAETIKAEKTPQPKNGTYHHTLSDRLNNDLHHIYEVTRAVSYFTNLASSTKAQLSNNPFLLLVGSAGTGKTHLLCDFVEHRMTASGSVSPGLLVFGEYFSNGVSFWEQTTTQLDHGHNIRSHQQLLTEISLLAEQAKARREYPNSPSFEDLRGDYNVWTTSRTSSDGVPVPVVVTDDSYLNEFTRNCSRSDSLTVKLPNKWLVNQMGLIHRHTDGRWFDKDGQLVATPTRVFDRKIPAALLMDRLALSTFLRKGGYEIVWTVLGDKRMIGGSLSGREFVGELNMSGVYTLDNRARINGGYQSRFRGPHD